MSETKKFGEVFPTLQLQGELKALMDMALVERISTTKTRSFLRVYISSDRLIFKRDLWKVEAEIKKQLFRNTDIDIHII